MSSPDRDEVLVGKLVALLGDPATAAGERASAARRLAEVYDRRPDLAARPTRMPAPQDESFDLFETLRAVGEALGRGIEQAMREAGFPSWDVGSGKPPRRRPKGPPPGGLHALTVWQPWPWAVVNAGKRVENRTWPLPDRFVGVPVALHAGGNKAQSDDLLAARRIAAAKGLDLAWPQTYVKSALVALVRFGPSFEVERPSAYEWEQGPYAWPITQVRRLARPVPCRGAQGLWPVPPAVALEVYRVLGEVVP